jgi:hypothetical protein
MGAGAESEPNTVQTSEVRGLVSDKQAHHGQQALSARALRPLFDRSSPEANAPTNIPLNRRFVLGEVSSDNRPEDYSKKLLQLERDIVFRIMHLHCKRRQAPPERGTVADRVAEFVAIGFVALPLGDAATVRRILNEHRAALPCCYRLMQLNRLALIRRRFPGANMAVDMRALEQQQGAQAIFMRQEMTQIREEMKGVKAEMKDVKAEMKGVKAEMKGVKAEMKGVIAELRAIRELLDELVRKKD